MTEVVAIGETMAAFVPKERGYLRYAGELEIRVAGAESNVAVGVSKLGHSSAWVSRLGDDELGRLIRNAVRAEGVDTSRVTWDEQYPTGLMVKQIRSHSETTVFYYRAGSAASHMEELDWDFLAQAKIIHMTGITPVLSESCRSLVLKTVEFAKNHGIWLSFDPNIRKKLWKERDYSSLMREIGEQAQILMMGQEEARQLYGTDKMEELAPMIFKKGKTRFAALKKGAEGAVVSDGKQIIAIPPHPCRCMDPVGAGDAFNAGFLCGILEGNSLELCGKKGAVAGALATEHNGDTEGIPEKETMERILEQRESVYR